jgi:hypothetical protein
VRCVCARACVHVGVLMCVSACVHTWVGVRVWVCLCICPCVCLCVSERVFVCVCVFICVCMHGGLEGCGVAVEDSEKRGDQCQTNVRT